MKKVKIMSLATGSRSGLLCYVSQVTFEPLALPNSAFGGTN
jgi:hypothetical protein